LIRQRDEADEAPLAVVLSAVADEDATVRSLALDLLEEQLADDPAPDEAARIVAVLGHALDDPDERVKAQAAVVLRQCRFASAVMPLAALASQPSADVRQGALLALREHRHPDARAAIELCLADAEPKVRREAVIAIGYLRDPRATAALPALQNDPDAAVRRLVVSALGLLGGAQAEQVAVAGTRDDDWQVRREAALALGRAGKVATNTADSSVTALLGLLDDAYFQVRKQAIEALGQYAARGALGQQAASEVAGALVRHLADPVADVRKVTALALGELSARDAHGAVRALLDDPDADVKKAVRQALTRLEA